MTENERSDLRAARRQQTHGLISRTALELALERGPSAVTVDEIATAAGVSRRTFFNYFAAKEDALLTGPPAPSTEELERFAADPDPSWSDALRRLLVGHARGAEHQRTHIHDTHRLLSAHPELAAPMHRRFVAFEESLVAAVADRGARTGSPVDAQVAAALSTALLRVATERWLAEEEPAEGRLAALVDEAVSALRGLLS
ncbi:TetR/AcrR family transcriptional regulator [Streptomyces xiaopingdaonensis]|uniref:TetR/AcrR family transcriptional regulator n=1 Tax=Streptomyces xiaopingdaonensis TaxID=1565415 RepID=UPI00031A82C3|nr:TetR/AcrR family transcriptional regulator [Streptomyces xiaopingdaonensis]